MRALKAPWPTQQTPLAKNTIRQWRFFLYKPFELWPKEALYMTGAATQDLETPSGAQWYATLPA